jgi:hypothetical protein
LAISVPEVKTAHVSSMVRLTAWSTTHLFFIVLCFSILTLSLSFLSRAQFAFPNRDASTF